MGVGLLFVAALVAGLSAYGSRRPVPSPAAPGPDASGEPGVLPPISVQPAPLFPEEEAEEIARILLERWPAAADIVQGVPGADPAAFAFLVGEATLNARILNLPAEGFDARPDLARIDADPGAFRGRPIRVSGALLALERLPAEGLGAQVREIRRGTVRDGNGRLWSFAWPVANPLEPDPVVPGAGWVRLHGILYKSWPLVDPAGPGEPRNALQVVLARPPVADFPPVSHRDIDPAWMEGVRDAAAIDMLTTDEDPFFHLLNFSRTLGPAGFGEWLKTRQAASPGLRIDPPEDFTGRYAELLRNPAVHRFRPVRYSGFLIRPLEQEVRPNPGGIEKAWVGFLVDADFAPAVWVFAPRSFVAGGFKDEDRVQVDGIFYKRRAYQPQGGGDLKQAAVIIACRISHAPLGTTRFGPDLLAALIALLVLLGGGFAWLVVQGRKQDRAAEAIRRERLARRNRGVVIRPPAASSAEAPPVPPPPPA
jgi:hypothetical protein